MIPGSLSTFLGALSIRDIHDNSKNGIARFSSFPFSTAWLVTRHIIPRMLWAKLKQKFLTQSERTSCSLPTLMRESGRKSMELKNFYSEVI
jgi:hypothetical protein